MYSDLQGKVALVTGSGQGIGRAIAVALAGEGVDVAVNVRQSVDQAQQVAKEIEGLGRRSGVYQADVSDTDAIEKMVAGVLNDFGKIDILVNNAGIPGTMGIPLHELRFDQWKTIIDANLNGAYACCAAVTPHMIERGSGGIVNISSTSSLKPLSLWGAYSVSKIGVSMLTRQLAMELATEGIRVNGIAPGLVETPRTATGISVPELIAPRLSGIPMGRPGRAEEIANVALFLLSEQSSLITGQIIVADGGETDFFPEMHAWAKRRGAQGRNR